MTPALKAHLEGWLAHPDPEYRRAAEIRLGLVETAIVRPTESPRPPPPFPVGGEIPIGPVPKGGRARVGFIVPCLLRGGTEEWHRQLVLGMDPDRVAVTGLVLAPPGHVHEETYSLFAGRVPTGRGVAASQALCDTSDVVVTWGNVSLDAVEVPAGTRVVGVSHGDANSKFTREALGNLLHRVTDWARCSSQAYVPEGVTAVTIPNGVDPARLVPRRGRDAVRAGWGWSDRRVLLYLGRFCEADKRVQLLPEVLARLPDEYVLVMMGDGGDGDRLVAKCDRLIPGRYRVEPWSWHVGDAMKAADAGVMLSSNESFCLALAEYVGAGLPAVSTPVGFAAMHPEAVKTLPASGTPAEYAAVIAADFSDPARAARVAAGAELVLRDYSTATFVARWEDYLCGLAPARLKYPTRDEIQAVRSCKQRSQPCGCQGAVCLKGRAGEPNHDGTTTVTLGDCLACDELNSRKISTPGTPLPDFAR